MNILIVGVGGQGTLLASKVLGRVYLSQGLDVKVGEVHGMSQRGGSVVTYVRAGERVGERVFSPVIERGEADVILAFEPLEAARWLPYLKTDGTVIASTQVLYPMPVLAGTAAYPAHVLDDVRGLGVEVIEVDAPALAREAGSVKAVNVALLGVLARRLELPAQIWTQALAAVVPAKTLEVNTKAFELGLAQGA